MPRPALTESAFRRYEPLLVTALRSKGCTFDPKVLNLQPTTVAARLRDALRSFRHFQWKSELTKEGTYGWQVVIDADDMIYVGPQRPDAPSPLDAKPLVGRQPEPRGMRATMVLSDATPEQLEAYAVLANTHLVGLPALAIPRTEANAPLAAVLDSLESCYDIAVTTKPHEWLII